jgi:dipeptidyl aminopeptidase/acylaminoacyl peptidase
MFSVVARGVSLAALAYASTLSAQAVRPLAEDAAVFGAREAIQHISLSPSGSKIAYVAPVAGHGEALLIVDLPGDAKPRRILVNSDLDTNLHGCTWANEEKLICRAHVVENLGGILLGYSRLVVVGADGKGLEVLNRSASYRSMGSDQYGGGVLAYEIEGAPDQILMQRARLPESDTGTRMLQRATGLTVERLDVRTRQRREVERPDPNAVGYIADDDGAVRIKMLRSSGVTASGGQRETYQYRMPGSAKWVELARGVVSLQSQTGFDPVAVDAASNRVFGFDDREGYRALYSLSLDGKLARELVLARPDVDVDGLVRLGRSRRVVGASFATERRLVEYFDPALAKLAGSLNAALPGRPQISFAGASADESKLLIVASSDVDPGMSYLLDRKTNKLEALLPIRDGLDGRALAKMTPIRYNAADGAQIPGYLTLPPGKTSARGLPAIVMPHGGPSSRDEWGFDWLVQFFAARGYAVLQPNFRGSSGYGSQWFGKNGFQAWRTAIGDVNDAGRWIVGQGANASQLAILGWSYGGYAALQSQVLDPSLYKAVVAIAPVTDLERLRQDAADYANFALVDRFVGNGPHVAAGSPARHADRFAAPVMLVHGTMDQAVDVEHARLMANRLKGAGKRVSYSEFEGLDHGLGDSAVRTRMLSEIAGFLAASLTTPK